MSWINVTDKLPKEFLEVLVVYADEDGENQGICKASLQSDGKWCLDFLSLVGEDPDDEYSKISHWAYINDFIKYPDE